MIAIDGGVACDLCIGKIPGLLFRGEQLDVGTQRSLVAFERQDIVGLLVEYLLRDIALAPDGIDRHDRSLDRQHRQ